MLAALVVAWGESRIAVVSLLWRACDFRRITDKVWYVPILLFRQKRLWCSSVSHDAERLLADVSSERFVL
jgi:hypothetical protein